MNCIVQNIESTGYLVIVLYMYTNVHVHVAGSSLARTTFRYYTSATQPMVCYVVGHGVAPAHLHCWTSSPFHPLEHGKLNLHEHFIGNNNIIIDIMTCIYMYTLHQMSYTSGIDFS